ncbi:YgaC family protein [Nonomuraea sp. RK-328]|nr:YgaC family protein [Nonomuraea sp. RK-328]
MVVYRKYGGALHWHHRGTLLGEDEHGVWVGVPDGTLARKGTDPPVRWETAIVILFPRDGWWTASFHASPHRTDVYVDVTTVPEWRDGDVSEVTMVDLDLDVIRMRDGRLFLDDEDEFAEHQVLLGYPAEVIARAEETAAMLMTAVGSRQGPFGGAHEKWLALAGGPA